MLGCSKKENYKPTVKLDSILKNEKLRKDYTEFRFENVCLSLGMEKKQSFVKFLKKTSIDDLLLMTECEKPIVRCVAFKILAERNYSRIHELLFKHQNDNEYLEVYYPPCIRMNEMVKVYMLEQLGPFSDSKMKFNRAEYDQIWADFFK